MGIKSWFVGVIVSCAVAFCGDNCNDDDGVACTEEFVYGLNVYVEDAQTNESLTQGVTVIAIDGNYEETLMLIESSDSFVGAGERDGVYILEISAIGYQTYISEAIILEHDGCHVIPQIIDVDLIPE
jgi:hypothetical protein